MEFGPVCSYKRAALAPYKKQERNSINAQCDMSACDNSFAERAAVSAVCARQPGTLIGPGRFSEFANKV